MTLVSMLVYAGEHPITAAKILSFTVINDITKTGLKTFL